MDHLQSIEPIWFHHLSTALVFPTSCSSGGTDNNRQFPQNKMRISDIGARGIQIGPFATSWTHFVPNTIFLLDLHAGATISYQP